MIAETAAGLNRTPADRRSGRIVSICALDRAIAESASRQDRPDRLVLDLDPDERVPWEKLVEALAMIRALLHGAGLEGYLKTTGGKGMHVVVPVRPTLSWAQAKRFTKAIAERLAAAYPERFVATASKARRRERIFVDYLRNAKEATAIAPYSTRARSHAPVATPVGWDELDRDLRFAHFSVRNVPERLRRTPDPWADFFSIEQAVSQAAIARIAGR